MKEEQVLMEGAILRGALLEFAKYIKSNYVLCNEYGSMFSSELTICDPPAEYLIDSFIKEKIKESKK